MKLRPWRPEDVRLRQPIALAPNALALLLISMLAAPTSAAPRPDDFGQKWVRSHPLTLMGLQQWPQTINMSHHQATNMSNLLVWWADGNGKQIAQQSSSAGNTSLMKCRSAAMTCSYSGIASP